MSDAAHGLARSYLFAPGDDDRLVQKVFTAGADAVVLDLEDAVALEHKADARMLVARTLDARGSVPGVLVFVRVNSIQSGLWDRDLEAVLGRGLDGIRLAKAEAREEVEEVGRLLDRLERERDLSLGRITIVPTIESAAGVLHAAEIASAPRVTRLAFGSTDLLRDIGASESGAEEETLYARSHLVLVSRVARLQPPIASVYTRLNDPSGLRRSSEAARRLGFFGRSCIHPAQLPVVHDVFTPSAAEISRARQIVEAYEHPAEGARSVFVLEDGQFVDRAVAERAKAVLSLAERLAVCAAGAEQEGA